MAHLFSIAASAVQKISAQRDRAEEEEVEVMRLELNVQFIHGLVRDMVSLPPITIAQMYLLNCLKRFIVRVFHAPLFNSL